MRVLSVSLENLNSLAGPWTIDFTRPEYARDGLFAINGPTGAGKTTLLDAICLALYGRTPRIPAGSMCGEIMTRGTTTCRAELTFEAGGEVYHCRWTVKRTHKDPQAKLAPATHEISVRDRAGDLRLLQSKLNKVEDEVERVTGLDYARFTKAILLAQGDFAAFLRSKAKDRGEILEKLTGTDIYSSLSMAAHKRATNEATKLMHLKAAMQEIKVLPDERRLELEGERNELALSISVGKERLVVLDRAIAWHTSHDLATGEVHRLTGEVTARESEAHALAPDRARLAGAVSAESAMAPHVALSLARREVVALEESLGNQEAALPSLQQAQRDAAGELLMAGRLASEAIDRQAKESVRIARLRALDAQLAQARDELAKRHAGHEAALGAVATHQARRDACQKEEEQSVAQLSRLSEQRDQLACNEEMTKEWSGWKVRLADLDQRLGQATALANEAASLAGQALQAGKAHEEAMAAAGEAARAKELQEAAVAKLQADLAEVSHGAGASELGQKSIELFQRVAQVDKTIQLWQDLLGAKEDHRQAMAKASHASETLGQVEAALASLDKRLADARQSAEQEKIRVAARNRIQDMEDARRHLKDGEECPLCGSLEHPFASGLPLQMDEAADAAEAAASLVRNLEEQMMTLGGERGSLSATLAHATDSARSADDRVQGLESQLRERGEESGVGQEQDEQRLAGLRAERTDLGQQQEVIADQSARVAALERALGEAKQETEDAARLAQVAREQEQAAGHVARSGADKAREVAAGAKERGEAAAAALEELASDMAPWGWVPKADNLQALAADIDEVVQAWLRLGQGQTDLERQLAAIVERRTELDMSHAVLAEQVAAAGLHLASQETEVGRIGTERRELGGDLVPDEEEARLARDVLHAETTRAAALEADKTAATALAAAEATLAKTRGDLRERMEKRESLLADFRTVLATLGFGDEQAWLDAVLPSQERQALEGRIAAVDKALSDTKALLEEKAREILVLEAKEVAGKDLARTDLETERADLAVERDVRIAREGEVAAELRLDDGARLRMATQLDGIVLQEQSCNRWKALDLLIGSADGKVFRDYAHRFTLATVIRKANKYLAGLNDRYVLDLENSSLEFHIRDAWHGGTIRAIDNLSGGETFLVSLALALGLSGMASRKARLDSLFLDEGFGTLDEQTLGDALDALASLKHEGKTVGIISHVPALKERIATQISVRPGKGGRSSLSGPGVTRGTA